MLKQFLVTIDADNDIEDKYPNFVYNYTDSEEFIYSIVKEIAHIAGDGTFGFDIFIEEVDNA